MSQTTPSAESRERPSRRQLPLQDGPAPGKLRTQDGYTAQADFIAKTDVPFVPDRSTEKPGKVTITGNVDFSVTVTNTTKGHDVLFGPQSSCPSCGNDQQYAQNIKTLHGPFVLGSVPEAAAQSVIEGLRHPSACVVVAILPDSDNPVAHPKGSPCAP